MSDSQPTVPYGFCRCGCGCGQKTNLADRTRPRWGHVKGEPMAYCGGHGNRKRVHYVTEDRGFTSPCWIWQLWRSREGYGRMADGTGVQRPAHRVMWERANGPIPEGLQIDHLCRTPSCVNPGHLEPVSPAENTRRSKTAKLDWAKVREIRSQRVAGATLKTLAEKYGVSIAAIWFIQTGRHWPPDEDPG